MNIGRTLFWFKDGDERCLTLDERFFAYGTLLNRLLNQCYSGKKLKFININFFSQQTFDLYPSFPKEAVYYYGGNLQYYGFLDYAQFDKLSEHEQVRTVWEKAYHYLKNAAEAIKNEDLLAACKYAFAKGLETNLDPDYRMLDTELTLHGKAVRASVWLNFRKDGMHSRLTIEKEGRVLFEKHLDKTKNGVEYFLVMYKQIASNGTNVIVKGRKDAGHLPLTVPISKDIVLD
ncbi:MAG TPA: hypothetical protein VFT06_02970 [Flavisolibacter sp.]|nr:hypothetical protein [Flavisolibacter sp.]